MAPYIHSKRNGGHIIDLTKTVAGLDEALDFMAKTASEGKQVLFVATKRQAQDIVKAAAEEAKMPFVTERRSEEHTSELQSLMRISYAVFCLKKKKTKKP